MLRWWLQEMKYPDFEMKNAIADVCLFDCVFSDCFVCKIALILMLTLIIVYAKTKKPKKVSFSFYYYFNY